MNVKAQTSLFNYSSEQGVLLSLTSYHIQKPRGKYLQSVYIYQQNSRIYKFSSWCIIWWTANSDVSCIWHYRATLHHTIRSFSQLPFRRCWISHPASSKKKKILFRLSASYTRTRRKKEKIHKDAQARIIVLTRARWREDFEEQLSGFICASGKTRRVADVEPLSRPTRIFPFSRLRVV